MRLPVLAPAVCLLALTGCGISSPSNNMVENFSGSVAPGGSASHNFSVTRSGGEIQVTITALGPSPSAFMGVAVGQPVTGGCSPLLGYVNNTALLNRQALGGPIDKGTYCVAIYDPGTLTATQTYTLRVSHP